MDVGFPDGSNGWVTTVTARGALRCCNNPALVLIAARDDEKAAHCLATIARMLTCDYRLNIRVDPKTNIISDVKFKTFGCGSAIASSSYLTELVRGMT